MSYPFKCDRCRAQLGDDDKPTLSVAFCAGNRNGFHSSTWGTPDANGKTILAPATQEFCALCSEAFGRFMANIA